ncbi:MAG: bifunctional DNA-formamidopyrimidine glycosylase/DNA-(apurinic or apyrimidinic site) lyase [Patescibacteria group bacterium]
MPELPEVEITRQKLINEKLIGAKIAGFWSDWPRGVQIAKSPSAINHDIKGRKIVGLRRVGKALFFDLGGKPFDKTPLYGDRGSREQGKVQRVLGWHFRMSGRLLVRRSFNGGASEGGEAGEKSIHVRVALADGREIAFRDPRKFGVVWYGISEELARDPYIGTLGPDMLSVKFPEFKRQLQSKNGMIKPVLLDQKNVAGIGNIIVDESLWHARIHPQKQLYKFYDREIIKIFKSLKFVINRILKARGSTMRDWSHPDGEVGGYEKIRWVYGRAGENCPRCGNIIKRIVVGGRGTSVCLKCQK